MVRTIIQTWYNLKKIGEGATVFSGYAFKSSDFTPYGIPVIKIKNVNNRIVTLSEIEHFPHDKVTEKMKKFFLENGDVLIAMTGQGSVGRVGKLRLSLNQKVLLNQRVGKFITKSNVLDSEFLYQVISSHNYEQILFDTGSGSGQPNLSPDDILDVEIPFPDIDKQRKIARILSHLDDQSWFLQRQNTTLEKIIQSLFKSWFVDFGGQTEFVDSELGKIPKGWKVKKFHEVIELLYGKSLTAEKRMNGQIPVYGSSGIVGHHNDFLVKGPGIIVGRKGNVGSVFWSEEDFYPIDTAYYVKTKIPLLFVYHSLKQMNFINSDSSVPGLQRNQAYSLDILIPEHTLINKFSQVANSAFGIIDKNKKKISILDQIRNSLFPKLMSGEIQV